jgi:cytochrome P450
VLAYRNADLKALAGNPAVGNLPAPLLAAAFNVVAEEGESSFQRLVGNHVFTANPPLHGPLRRVFARQFMPKNVLEFAPLARTTVRELVDEGCAAGELDFTVDFANRLTAKFWGRVIGLTHAEEDRIARMSDEIAPAFFLHVRTSRRPRSRTPPVSTLTSFPVPSNANSLPAPARCWPKWPRTSRL